MTQAKTSQDNAVWGTVTLAAPQLVEWQIEGAGPSQQGRDLRGFLNSLAQAAEGREAVLRVNLLLSL